MGSHGHCAEAQGHIYNLITLIRARVIEFYRLHTDKGVIQHLPHTLKVTWFRQGAFLTPLSYDSSIPCKAIRLTSN